MKKWRLVPIVLGLTLLTACKGTEPEEGLVARAGDQLFTVDDAVQLLVDQENLPNQTDVVRALADIWTDYTLLATAVARDSTLSQLDLEPLVQQQLDQQMISEHMDSVLQVDTAITDKELRSAYDTEAPGVKIHVSHILLGFPDQATDAQRDSVRAEIEGIRKRAMAGESFAALARSYSQDPGSASQGGDLGTVSRDGLVKPFADAAFALDPGEISDIVETPFGLHLIRLESKESTGFDSAKAEFRQQVQSRRIASAQSTYVAKITEARAPKTADDAFNVMKELAKDPGAQLSRRAASRSLVTFKGGKLTVGDFQTFVQSQQPQFRDRVAAAPDAQLTNLLDGLTQRRMLIAEARDAGLSPSKEHVDSLLQDARTQVLRGAQQIGLTKLDRAPGEPAGPAIARSVHAALQDILSGATNVVPLGPIGFQLRSRVATAVYDTGLGQVVLDVGKVRAGRKPSPSERPDSTPAADTSGAPTGTR